MKRHWLIWLRDRYNLKQRERTVWRGDRGYVRYEVKLAGLWWPITKWEFNWIMTTTTPDVVAGWKKMDPRSLNEILLSL